MGSVIERNTFRQSCMPAAVDGRRSINVREVDMDIDVDMEYERAGSSAETIVEQVEEEYDGAKEEMGYEGRRLSSSHSAETLPQTSNLGK